jgi:hypothetical protein
VKVSTPLGDYDYRVERVAVRHGQLEVDGSLGAWQTKMVIERSDLSAWARRAAPALAAAAVVAIVTRRRAQRR